MSQKNDQSPSEPPRRFQDFLVLTSGGVAVLALLFLTGAIGLVEWITGATVMTAGALAFYVGSAPSSNRAREAEVLAPPPAQTAEPREGDIEQFILGFASAGASDLIAKPDHFHERPCHAFCFDSIQQQASIPLAMLRQPDLLAAAERVQEDGANERVEFTQHGDAEVWMAHVRSGPETGSVLMVFEDLTAVRRAERARAELSCQC